MLLTVAEVFYLRHWRMDKASRVTPSVNVKKAKAVYKALGYKYQG